MSLVPVVEGHGEVHAFPELLRRLREVAGVFHLQIAKPVRRNRSDLVKEETLRRSIRLALLTPDCEAILVLLDADDDCPRDLVVQMQLWAQDEARTIPCAVVIAKSEYEAWFLGAIESLGGARGIDVAAHTIADPEAIRDAKGTLERLMPRGRSYHETLDQTSLTATFDMALAYRRCRSFRKLTKAFGELANVIAGPMAEWPPADWIAAR